MVEPTKAKQPDRENADMPRPDAAADKSKLAPNEAAAAEPEADSAE